MKSLTQAIEIHEDLIQMDGYADCIHGICYRFGQNPIIAYDYDKVIKKLKEDSGMSYDEAVEFWEFNQIGAYVGENTPCFIERIKK